MIFMSANNKNDALYIDYESTIMYLGKNIIGDDIKERTDEELDEISYFINENLQEIFSPFLYELYRFYHNYPDELNLSAKIIIDWFLYNFHDMMKESKYYEDLIDDFCNYFNTDKDYILYMFMDSIDLMVYNDKNKEFYMRDESGNDTKIITYSKYKKNNPLECDDEVFKERRKIFEKNISLAKEKNINKNLIFMIIFKFASTVRNIPMTIIDSDNLKFN